MSRSWRQHPAAAAELRDAVLYLEEVREGLGERFLDAVDTALRSIIDDPEAWSIHRGRARIPAVRTRSVSGFRYDIKYVVVADAIIVLAFAHERRRPGYWADRLG
ncbi:ParE-like toxin of type II ParDE toxin-antitoxin system [Microcella putealis]|uniref:ParE-like toxin of type II ParDE toxin-antitoxin system n=1 Tax=Microcella putealis TaxID=337005 RepID=A0A4Q7LNX7_9MICO|nr:type II toxin-antitoxin system RelE/ParE family toxin [Microcella putealis]RZS56405.1 ParE-like toxin of type II ParDE toxin-antitoxin system [Microcella putealis]TQM27109.1 ParE-like toxin of type II ParDE toxin-antitoxin system [Microcella putealis]